MLLGKCAYGFSGHVCGSLSVRSSLPSHNVSCHFSHKSQLHKSAGYLCTLLPPRKASKGEMNQQYATSAKLVHTKELNSKHTLRESRGSAMQIAAHTIPKPALAAFNHALSPLTPSCKQSATHQQPSSKSKQHQVQVARRVSKFEHSMHKMKKKKKKKSEEEQLLTRRRIGCLFNQPASTTFWGNQT